MSVDGTSMRDPGLSEAIQAAGGVTELARRIGISQPSVSNWDRVPAERVLAVEAATGVERTRAAARSLSRTAATAECRRSRCRARAGIRAALRAARARARCRSAAAPVAVCAAMRRRSASRMSALARGGVSASTSSASSANISISSSALGRGELLPYGSYYLTGFLHERPLARLRDDLAASASSGPRAMPSRRITPRSCARSWRAFAGGRFAAPEGTEQQIFEKHMAPWIGPLLRRSRARRSREFLSPRRHARPRVHRNRNGSLRAAGVTGARQIAKEETAMKSRRQDDGRPSRFPSRARRRRRRAAAAAPLAATAARRHRDQR